MLKEVVTGKQLQDVKGCQGGHGCLRLMPDGAWWSRGLLLGRCHVGLENRCGGPHGGRGITSITALLSISSGPGTV